MIYDYGPAIVDLRFVQGDDFEMVVDVEGDVDADTFAAAIRTKKLATTISFTTAVGAYNAGTNSTPVTVSMADTASAALDAGQYVWDLEWTTAGGAVRTIAGGVATVIEDYTP